MRFGSVCSGIEAASVAWEPLGWQAAWFSEIEPFPSAVLAHHYPQTPNWGDMTQLPEMILGGQVEAPDILCGGTPCQAFSVAGLRRSLDDARGNLSLTFCEIANAIDHVRVARGEQPCIIFWENVPGVLSTKDNAFGCFLAGLAGEDGELEPPGGRWTDAGFVDGPQRAVAWRVLDAQYFGVAQRRRRVFVVASARDDFDPAAVLFEFDGLRRDTAPSRETGEAAAAGTLRSTDGGCDLNHARAQHLIGQPFEVTNCLTARMHKGINSTLDEGQTPVVTHSLRGEGFDASEDGTGRGTPLVPVHAFDARQSDVIQYGDKTGPLDTDGHTIGVAVGTDCYNGAITGDVAATLGTPGSSVNASGPTVMQPVGVTLHGTDGTQSVASFTDLSSSLRSRIPSGVENSTTTAVMQPVAFDTTQVTSALNRSNPKPGDPCHPLGAGAHAPAIAFSSKDHGADATADLAPTLRAMNHADSHANGGGQMAVACIHADAIGRTGTAVTPSADAEGRVRLRDPGMGVAADGTSYNLMASGQPHGVVAPAAVAYTTKLHNTASNNAGKLFEERTTCLDANSPPPALLTAMQIRRLTPRECERLQGFPDDYTAIPWRGKPADQCPDGPRYKALGNSWAVPVVRWIGARIDCLANLI